MVIRQLRTRRPHDTTLDGRPADFDLYHFPSTMRSTIIKLLIILVISFQCLPVLCAYFGQHQSSEPCSNSTILNCSFKSHLSDASNTSYNPWQNISIGKSVHKRDINSPFHGPADYFFHDISSELDLSEAAGHISALRRTIDSEHESDRIFRDSLLDTDHKQDSGFNDGRDNHRYFLPPQTQRKSFRVHNRPAKHLEKLDSKDSTVVEAEQDVKNERIDEKQKERERIGWPLEDEKNEAPYVPYSRAAIRNTSNSHSLEYRRKPIVSSYDSGHRVRPSIYRRASRQRSKNPQISRYQDLKPTEEEELHHGSSEISDTFSSNLNDRQRNSGQLRGNRPRSFGSDHEKDQLESQQPTASSRIRPSGSQRLSAERELSTPNQSSDNQANQVYRPNYQHYESRGSFSPPNIRGLADPKPSRSESNGNLVFPNTRTRYLQSRPQTVGDFRTQSVFNSASRLPTILVPNQDIRQLSKPLFASTPSLLPSVDHEDSNPNTVSRYSSNPAPMSYDQRNRQSRTDSRRSMYRTVVADHLIDEEDPRTIATTARPVTSSEASLSIQTIPFDYHYNYERDKRPTYDYQDQPESHYQPLTTTTSTQRPVVEHRPPPPPPPPRTRSNQQPQYAAAERPYRRQESVSYRSPESIQYTATTTPVPPSQAVNTRSQTRPPPPVRPAGRINGNGARRRRKRLRASTSTTTTTTTSQPYYYDNEYEYDYEEDYESTTTTTTRPRRKGRRGQRRSSTTSTTTSTTPMTTTTTLSPGYKHRPDNRIIDYMADPNFPHELKGADLTDYPFYISLPTDIHFNCEGRHDGYYASIEHRCQVYHHCALGHRYDFLCPNYTLFDQTTFTCRFVNTVDCLKSESYFNKNDELYVETTEEPESGEKPKKEKKRQRRDYEQAVKESEKISENTEKSSAKNSDNGKNDKSTEEKRPAKKTAAS